MITLKGFLLLLFAWKRKKERRARQTACHSLDSKNGVGSNSSSCHCPVSIQTQKYERDRRKVWNAKREDKESFQFLPLLLSPSLFLRFLPCNRKMTKGCKGTESTVSIIIAKKGREGRELWRKIWRGCRWSTRVTRGVLLLQQKLPVTLNSWNSNSSSTFAWRT